jgi:hypothetical protein
MKNLTLFVLTLFVLTACGPGAKLRRAERLINQAVAAGAKVKVDTVYVEKIIPGPETTVSVPVDRMVLQLRDTVIYQDRIKIHYQLKRDTFRMHVVCPPDTIRIPVTVHKSIIAPPCPKDRFWKGVGFGAGGLLILLIIYGVTRLIKP